MMRPVGSAQAETGSGNRLFPDPSVDPTSIGMFFHRARADSLSGLPGLETARLSIAALAPGDAEALASLTDDPAITGAVDFLPTPFTLADARALIASGRRREDRFFGARTREGRVLVGVIGVHLRGTEAVEVGYWIAGAARGRGVATEAVGGILALLVGRFPRRTVVAECRPGNVASWGLLLKLGFHDTGEEGHRPGRRLMALRSG